jgi:hypothetical protein
MAKILVLYDKWKNISAERMWCQSFIEAMGDVIDNHECALAISFKQN